MDNSEWYALVKYKSGNTTEILPVHKIKVKLGKGEREAFNPKSLMDFDKTKFYTVTTTHGSEDGKEHKWYALIGLLAESREALERAIITKRVSWPNITLEDESEPNSSDDAQRAGLTNVTMISNREFIRNKKKAKKDATDAIHEKLLASRHLNSSSNTCSNTSMSIIDDGDIVTRLLQENKELKCKLKAEKKRNPSTEERDYANTLQESLQRIEEKVEKMQETFQQKLDNTGKVNLEKFIELEKKLANVEDSIMKSDNCRNHNFKATFEYYVKNMIMLPQNCHVLNLKNLKKTKNTKICDNFEYKSLTNFTSIHKGMRPPLSSTCNEILSNQEEKIPLGDGVFCSKAAYSTLVNVEESHANWAYALLKGVFGEKAHLMRVRIKSKNTENERFPSNFLMVAKSLHRDWLVQQKIQDENGQLHSKYSATEVEKYVNSLPAYLADRAYDMQGPRGARKGGEDLNAPECRRNRSTETKRKYMRRGQSLFGTQFQLPPPQQLIQQLVPLQQPLPPQQPLQQQQSLPPQQPLLQQQPHPPQQPLSQQSYQELPLQPSQLLLQEQLFHSTDFPASTSGAMACENFETAATFTTL